MNKPKTICKNKQSLIPTFFLTGFLLFFFLISTNPICAQENSKAAQWKSAGGQIVASGNYRFKQSDPVGGIMQGSFTVQGPGYIGVVYKRIRSVSPGVHLRDSNNGRTFLVRYLGSRDMLKGADGNWKWYPPVMITEDYTPNANKGGWVPLPTINEPTTTLEVWVSVEGGSRENDDRAIEYEFWFFPLEGGTIISSTFSNEIEKPMPGVLYYTDKECK